MAFTHYGSVAMLELKPMTPEETEPTKKLTKKPEPPVADEPIVTGGEITVTVGADAGKRFSNSGELIEE